MAHGNLSSTSGKWGLLFIDLGGQGKRLSWWWEVGLSAPIPLAGDPDTRTAGRGGLALGPAPRSPPWGTPALPLPPLAPLLRPCPLPGGLWANCLLAWAALIFPLLIIRFCLWRRQTGAPGVRPAQAQVRGSAMPGMWLVGLDTKGSCINKNLQLYPFREVHSLWLPLLLLWEVLLEYFCSSRGPAYTSQQLPEL